MQPPNQILPALVLTLAAAGALAWAALKPGASRRRELWFSLLILVPLAAWRWPALYSPVEFNPDEGQMIAGALTLFRDPVFWRAVDGTTSGPLNFYALMPLLAVDGLPAVFAARLTGLLMVWLALVASFALLRRAAGPVGALLGFLPLCLFFALTTDSDFIHYSSEHLSLALIALAALLLWESRALAHGAADWRWLLAAFCAGLLPWAKLQSAPLAAYFALVAVGLSLAAHGNPASRRLLFILTFAGAALLPAGLFLGMLAWTDQLPHFVASYISNNISYATGGATIAGAVSGIGQLITRTWSFPVFAVGCLSLTAAGICAAALLRRSVGWLFVLSGIAVMAAAAAVLASRQAYPHYLLFLALPGAWLAAAGAKLCVDTVPRHRTAIILLALIPGLFSPLVARLSSASSWGFVPAGNSDVAPGSKIAGLVSELARPGDSLAIWGWCPLIWVECRLPQGTRDGNSYRQLQSSSQRDDYYRPRFLADLKQGRPKLFIDVTGAASFLFTDRRFFAHENYAELADYVRSNYRLVADAVGGCIYIRRDLPAVRMAELERAENVLSDLHARGETPVTLPTTGLSHRTVYRRDTIHLQTPAEILIPLDADEREFLFSYGFEPFAYVHGDTNGAELRVELLVPDQPGRTLFVRRLDPRTKPADRGVLSARVPLPPHPAGAQLAIRSLPGAYNNNAWDWVFLGDTRFVRSLRPLALP